MRRLIFKSEQRFCFACKEQSLQRAELAKDCNSRREHWLLRVSVGDYDSH